LHLLQFFASRRQKIYLKNVKLAYAIQLILLPAILASNHLWGLTNRLFAPENLTPYLIAHQKCMNAICSEELFTEEIQYFYIFKLGILRQVNI